MVELDGSAGGGQILRTSLTLSMLSGEQVTVENVRGNRSEPGLKHQHLAAVETAAAVCDADLEGAELGAESVSFDPGEPTGGEYEASIDTAGSCTLVFDTLWPVATVLEEPLALSVTGGTDAKWSPPATYYRRVKLPVLRESGLAVTVDVERPGFYPAGGGRATLRLWPSSPSPLALDGGAVDASLEASVHSLASESLADAAVADRQADAAASALADLTAHPGPDVVRREVSYAAADCPGSSVVVGIHGDAVRAGFTAFGERGTPAEDVGREAVTGVEAFLDSGAGADEHLADQCLVALALGGGRLVTPCSTAHLETNCAVLDAFGYDVSVETSGDCVVVTG